MKVWSTRGRNARSVCVRLSSHCPCWNEASVDVQHEVEVVITMDNDLDVKVKNDIRIYERTCEQRNDRKIEKEK